MKTKLHVVFMLLLFYSFMPHAFATDYYTASASATLAGNSAASVNWTTNPDGTTGLTSVTIATTDNLIILNGGTATITGGMSVNAVNIDAGGTLIHNNNATGSSFTINGLLSWNGTLKTLNGVSGSNYFSVNGDVTGTTAIHDAASNRGVYLGGTGKTLSLTQLSSGISSASSISVGILFGGTRSLVGDCKLYSPLVMNTAGATLDLAGFNLQVTNIRDNNASCLIKGNINSKLTISGARSNAATKINFDSTAAVLNELNVNNEYGVPSASLGVVTIGTNLIVNSLNFGNYSGDVLTRSLVVNGNFSLANNGSMRVRTGGTTAITNYDQLSASSTGSISIGTSTTLKVDYINSYTTTPPALGTQFDFATSAGTLSGSFANLQMPASQYGNLTYLNNKVTLTTSGQPAPTYYTTSPNATLAGNSATSANWTTSTDGTTGLGPVTINSGDNLVILNGGTATITGGMSVNAVNINAGGTLIHNNNATGSSFTINGLLTWNGTIKTIQAASGSNFFLVNGDVTGTTAIHDGSSSRGVYLGGTGKKLSLTQLSSGISSASSISVGILFGGTRSLVGDCKLYSPLVMNTAGATLDLAGFNLQVTNIRDNNATCLIKGNSNSKLTISGARNNAATKINFVSTAAVLNELNVDNEYGVPSASLGVVTIGNNLTVNALNFGTASGDTATRNLQVNGNFTIADNGSMRVKAGGPTAVTTYDQLNATGNISIGASTTLKVDFINSYSTSSQPSLDFAKSSAGTVSGIFTTVQVTAGYTGTVSYPGTKVTYQLQTTPAPIMPPSPCPVTFNPDLPLLPSNATVEAEIETIVKSFSDSYLGTTEPTAAALSSAVASYNALNISVDGYSITAGTAVTTYTQVTFLKTFAQWLKFHPDDTDIFNKALNTVWLVSDRTCKGLFDPGNGGYNYRDFIRPTILIPHIKDYPHQKGLFENLLNRVGVFDHLWDSNYDGGINDDYVGQGANVAMAYVTWINSADERYRYMTAFKRYMENFISYPTAGANDYSGIKPDGSGFHHNAAYPSYMYNLNAAADIISNLSGTSFQVSSAGYLRLRDAIMAQLMFANEGTVTSSANPTRFLTMAGRKASEVATTISRFSFRSMAVAGGSILGTGTSDPVMASYYNRVWGGYGPFGNGAKDTFNEGYFQFNYSMAGIYRKNNWVAVCKGFNNNMLGSEIFPAGNSANRFGRYQSYGAVNIIYPGDAVNGNGYDYTTWDWNFTPGATVIRLPWDKLEGETERVDELQQKRFVGSLSFVHKDGDYLKAIKGTYGLFAMDFQEAKSNGWGTRYHPESHNTTFVFKKSVFTFDNMLICLGSGIGNNDATNTTLTALYQRKAISGKEQVTVDGNALSTGTYNTTYADTDNHWVVDNFGTGFYVFAGSGTIQLSKADQQTPNHDQYLSAQTIANNPIGNYAIGYLDHGTAPSNKGYEYVCMPKATASDMTTLGSQIDAGNKPYTVHRKDEIAHIVEYKPTATANAIFGYSFFNALSGIDNSGQLTSADTPCLVMSQYDSAQKTLKMAVTNPDLGFTWRAKEASAIKQINITIKGTNWQISQPNANASITGTANGETTIQFTTVDGLPVEIALSRVLTPQTIGFEALPTKITTDTAFDLTATASSNLPVTYTSSNTEVATISGSTVTIVGKGSTTITAKQDGDDIYGAAEAVEQTLTVNPVAQTITFDAIPTKAIGDTTFDLTATASSNLPVTYTSSNTDVATISGSTVTIVGKGTTTITASQEGNNIYDVATAVEQILKVNTEATVSITSPLSNASYDALANITIAADAVDSDGSVSKVEFFNGTIKLGEDVTAPYSFDWNNVATGTYVLTAKVTDNDGAVTTSTVVTIDVVCPTVQLSIPDVYAMNPAIDDKNTIYIGYGPTSLTLNSLVQGDQDVTYTWNTGAHTPSITVSQSGTYTLTVTYAGGCQSTASITINTLDVRCGNDNTKVQICHNNTIICVAQSAVQAHLDHGDKLGSCSGTSKMATKEEVSTSSNFTVYPNPVQDNFNVTVSSKLDPNATISIYNVLGIRIRQFRFTAVPQNVYAGDLATGNYIVVVQNGVETFRSTIVKQ